MTSVFTQNGPGRSTWFKKRKKDDNRNTLGRELEYFELDHAVKTDSDENRKRRTLNISKKDGESWGFTLQSYGIHHTKESDVEMLTYVDYVDFGGPAHVAGMQAGDVILSINGVSMESSDHAALIEHIRHQGHNMRLVVLFEDCVRKVELHLRLRKLKSLLAAKEFELKSLEVREKRITDGFGSLSDSRWSLRSTTSSTNFSLPHETCSLHADLDICHATSGSPFQSPKLRNNRDLSRQHAVEHYDSRLSFDGDHAADGLHRRSAQSVTTLLDSSFTDSIYSDSDGLSPPNMTLNPRVDLKYTSLPSNFRRKEKCQSHVGKSTFYSPSQDETRELNDTDSVFGNELSRDLTVYQTWTGAAPEIDRDSGIYNTWSGSRKKKRRGETRSIGNSLFYVESEDNLDTKCEEQHSEHTSEKSPFDNQRKVELLIQDKPPDINYEQMGARPKSRYSTSSDSQLAIRHKKEKDAFNVKYRHSKSDFNTSLKSKGQQSNSLVISPSARSRRPSSLPIIPADEEVVFTPDMMTPKMRDCGIESPVFLENNLSVPTLSAHPAEKLSHVHCDISSRKFDKKEHSFHESSPQSKRKQTVSTEVLSSEKPKRRGTNESPKPSPLLNMKKMFTRSPSLPSLHTKSKWSPFEFTRTKLRNSLSKLRKKSKTYNLSDSKLSLPGETSDSKSGHSTIAQLIRSASTVSLAQVTKHEMSGLEVYATLPKKSRFLSFGRRSKSAGNVFQNEQTHLKVQTFIEESDSDSKSDQPCQKHKGYDAENSTDSDRSSHKTYEKDVIKEVSLQDEKLLDDNAFSVNITTDDDQTAHESNNDPKLRYELHEERNNNKDYVSEFQELSDFDFQSDKSFNQECSRDIICEKITECNESVEVSESVSSNDHYQDEATSDISDYCTEDDDSVESMHSENKFNNEKPLVNTVWSNEPIVLATRPGDECKAISAVDTGSDSDIESDRQSKLESDISCESDDNLHKEKEMQSVDNGEVSPNNTNSESFMLDSARQSQTLSDVSVSCDANTTNAENPSISENTSELEITKVDSTVGQYSTTVEKISQPSLKIDTDLLKNGGEIMLESVILAGENETWNDHNDLEKEKQSCNSQNTDHHCGDSCSDYDEYAPKRSVCPPQSNVATSQCINSKDNNNTENQKETGIQTGEGGTLYSETPTKAFEGINIASLARDHVKTAEEELEKQKEDTLCVSGQLLEQEEICLQGDIEPTECNTTSAKYKSTQRDCLAEHSSSFDRSTGVGTKSDFKPLSRKETYKTVEYPKGNRSSRLREKRSWNMNSEKSKIPEKPLSAANRNTKNQNIVAGKVTKPSDQGTTIKSFDTSPAFKTRNNKRNTLRDKDPSPINIVHTKRKNLHKQTSKTSESDINNKEQSDNSKSFETYCQNIENKCSNEKIDGTQSAETTTLHPNSKTFTNSIQIDIPLNSGKTPQIHVLDKQDDTLINTIEPENSSHVQLNLRQQTPLNTVFQNSLLKGNQDKSNTEHDKSISDITKTTHLKSNHHTPVSKTNVTLSTPAKLSTSYGAKIRSRSKSPLAFRNKLSEGTDAFSMRDVQEPVLGYSYKPRTTSFTSTVIENKNAVNENKTAVISEPVGMYKMISNSVIKAAHSKSRSLSENINGNDGKGLLATKLRSDIPVNDVNEKTTSNSKDQNSHYKASFQKTTKPSLDLSIKSAYETSIKCPSAEKISVPNPTKLTASHLKTTLKSTSGSVVPVVKPDYDKIAKPSASTRLSNYDKSQSIIQSRNKLSNVIQMCMDRDEISKSNRSSPLGTASSINHRKPIVVSTNEKRNKERYLNYINKQSCETQL